MKAKTFHIYIFLLLLTIGSSIIVGSFEQKKPFISIVLIVWAIKFLLVALSFMEIKKAHIFWKVSLSVYLAIIVTIIILLHKSH